MTPPLMVRILPWSVMLLAAAVDRGFAKDPLDQHGGHTLAKRPATLENLLDQPDWDAPAVPPPPPVVVGGDPEPLPDQAPPRPPVAQPPGRPQVKPMPPPLPAAATVVADLQATIEERNRIVDRCNLFETFGTIIKEEAELRRRAAILNAALVRQKQAAENADMLNHPGANQVAPEAKANALGVWQNAQAAAQAAQRDWQMQANALQPLYGKVNPEIKPWLDCYARMRRVVRADRRDPDRQSILGVIEGAIRSRGDFHEGRVLAALLQTFDGNEDAAKDHLRQACEGIATHQLLGTAFANDCCHAYLLLCEPAMVKDFIAILRKLDPARQTAVRCWMVGLYGMVMCRDNEAGQSLRKALAKANFFKKDAAIPPEAAPLLGDAALFSLTANTEKVRDVALAKEILDKADPKWDAWQLQRARAALLAEDGKWDDAVSALAVAIDACPPALVAEVKAQQDSYAGRERWVRPRPAAKVAVRP